LYWIGLGLRHVRTTLGGHLVKASGIDQFLLECEERRTKADRIADDILKSLKEEVVTKKTKPEKRREDERRNLPALHSSYPSPAGPITGEKEK
jgi:hypothetical protein